MATRRIHLPPDAVRVLRRQGSRIGRLEQRDGIRDTGPDPASVVFTLPGPVTPGSFSSPYLHPSGGLVVSARCRVQMVDPTAETEILFYRNETEISPVHSWSGAFDSAGTPTGAGTTTYGRCVIAAGQAEAVAFFSGRRLAPNLDSLTVAIGDATGAAGSLTVRVDFG